MRLVERHFIELSSAIKEGTHTLQTVKDLISEAETFGAKKESYIRVDGTYAIVSWTVADSVQEIESHDRRL